MNKEQEQASMEKAKKLLPDSLKENVLKVTQREIDAYCNYSEQEKVLEEMVQKERAAIVVGLEETAAITEELTGLYEKNMTGNSVYAGTYANMEEQKEDAKNALVFAKRCVEAKNQVGATFGKYGMAAMQRMCLPATWKKPSDPALKQKVESEAALVARNSKSKGKAWYLLPLLLGVLFIFVPLMLRGVISEAADEWFYSMEGRTFPRVLNISIAIAVVGIVVIWIVRAIKKAIVANYASWYALHMGLFEKAEQQYEKLSQDYETERKKLKEHSDVYSDLSSNKLMGDMINGLFLAPFPAEYMTVGDLEAAISLLDTGRANSLNEVYNILQQAHYEIARLNAEKQKAEKERAERERIEAQRAQEEYARQKAFAEKESSAEYAKQEEVKDTRNYKTVILEGVRHGKLNDTSTPTYITDVQTGREYRIYNYHKTTGYFEDENQNIYYFDEYHDLDNINFTGKYRAYGQSEWDADKK